MRKICFVRKPHEHRDVVARAGRFHFAFTNQLLQVEHRVLVNVEVPIHGILRHDRGQQRLVLRHEIADGDQGSG